MMKPIAGTIKTDGGVATEAKRKINTKKNANKKSKDPQAKKNISTPEANGKLVLHLETSTPKNENGDLTVDAASCTSSTTSSSNKHATPTKKSTPSGPSFTLTKCDKKGKVTYISMIHDAIVQIADRTGSSVPAISKFMLSKHTHLKNVTNSVFKHSLNTALKTGTKEERFIKIKASYKVNTKWVKKEKAAFRAKENEKKAKERKRKKDLEKFRAIKKKKDDEDKKIKAKILQEEREKEEKLKKEEMINVVLSAEEERKKLAEEKAKEEAMQKKAEAAARAKALHERIRKRKFPMDDLALLSEDKELGVKPPASVTKAPFLPFALSSLIPCDKQRPTGVKATPSSVVTACTSTMSGGSRGLISDVLQVYHFFRGDVGYSRKFTDIAIPPFTLCNLMHAVNEIIIGNSKSGKVVPPLISCLFLAALNILTNPSDKTQVADDDAPPSKKIIRFHNDLKQLNMGLSETSWGEILFCYLNLMETFYTTDVSSDPNALPGFPITMDYEADENENNDDSNNILINDAKGIVGKYDMSMNLPEGYDGYLGPMNGSLVKAYNKLSRNDPWNLSAEELMAMLRSLTDDILATNFDLAKDIAARDVHLFELLKSKKAAESQYRKMRLGYEGPKWPKSKPKKKSENNIDDGAKIEGKTPVHVSSPKPEVHSRPSSPSEQSELKSANSKTEVDSTDAKTADIESSTEKKVEFKRTATKKQFDAAEKARVKAIDAYEKGLKKLIARTEPIGYDRNYNAVYFFHHDPETVYVEVDKSQENSLQKTKSWHIIDNKSLFDEYLSSLDIRGVRESELYEELSGGNGTSLKRFLYDDNKKKSLLLARKREEEEFDRRLINAKIACDAEEAGGRRSGRLASNAKVELMKLMEEMELASQMFKVQTEEKPLNYFSLTGLELLSEFESKSENSFCCSKLWNSDESDMSGIVGLIVSDMFSIEELCHSLSPWGKEDLSRDEWRSKVMEVADTWKCCGSTNLGPAFSHPNKHQQKGLKNNENSGSKRKRKSDSYVDKLGQMNNSPSTSQMLLVLKESLIELESRVWSITGLDQAVQAVDEANDNISVTSQSSNSSNKEASERAQTAWKKKIHSLNSIPASRASTIRDVLISAIALARKGRLTDVLTDLRSALKLLRPTGGGMARTAALSLLKSHGGYDKSVNKEDDTDDDESDTEMEEDSLVDERNDDNAVNTFLCPEAMMLSGSIGGDDIADRLDWKDGVLKSKTISRFAALTQAFLKKAIPLLKTLQQEKQNLLDALEYWDRGTSLKRKGKGQSKKKERFNSATKVWASTSATDRFVLGKVPGYPWWPARICSAKQSSISSALSSVNRVLISFVGEQHIYVVKDPEEVRPYRGEMVTDEDLSKYDSNLVKKLKESLTMTKRVMRGKGLLDDVDVFVEEKKSSS